MKAAAKIFYILGVFLLVVGAAYGYLTWRYEPMGIEGAGFPAILATSGLSFMIAVLMTITLRKHDQGAAGDENAEVSDEAGVQGSFAPYSWAPLWLSIGCAMAFLGVAAGWWILAIGVVFVIYGIISWVLEFSVGQHQH
ncbi:cytochrome c oxidase subunit 4 [Brachybacterium sp. J153]|uniref:cytochrome c oxidase subunit 4 n=1 Tax=Brachybacterium sp. J153 TaxID=3116488 RepID=UPI002E78BCC3|nr:cytochrome c oxidase subunit 4 [Brachybacterium sp. J153]MEE1617626.1 cytochrome c oxidase subunit 4 [Brachybacterium sp. J153]